MKTNFYYLYFELTRKCNMNCKHCMKGQAQNSTISKKIIDSVLDQVGYVMNLDITGGEPMLEPELIEYLVDAVIDKGVIIGGLNCITNGTIKDERIANAFNKAFDYAKYCVKHYMNQLITESKIQKTLGEIRPPSYISLTISDDEWHKDELTFKEAAECLDFYKENCPQIVCHLGSEYAVDNSTYNTGKAVTLDIEKRHRNYKHCFNLYNCVIHNDEVLDFVGKAFYVSTNGNVVVNNSLSYEMADSKEYCCGNVLEKSIEEIIVDTAWKYPISKSDNILNGINVLKLSEFAQSALLNNKYDGAAEKQYLYDLSSLYDQLIEGRKELHLQYPHLRFTTVQAISKLILQEQQETNFQQKIILRKAIQNLIEGN